MNRAGSIARAAPIRYRLVDFLAARDNSRARTGSTPQRRAQAARARAFVQRRGPHR